MRTISLSSLPLPESVFVSLNSLLLVFTCLLLSVTPSTSTLPSYVGPQDRFWRHHVTSKSLILNGVDHYDSIYACLFDDDKGKLSEQDVELLNIIPTNRTVGKTIQESVSSTKFASKTIFVEIQNAMTPIHAKAIQSLAECVRTHIPSLHERRAMYKEFELEEDPGIGGNNPTHLAPLVGIFLPKVREDMMRVLSMAHAHANWTEMFVGDPIEFDPETKSRTRIHPPPSDVGFRASEHLTYETFPKLAAHHDGGDTAYTLNYALSAPDDYEGGYLYVLDKAQEMTKLKPNRYSASVFLGGLYLHGVTEIYGGHREMFSSEMWYNPDLPFGANLWSGNTKYMESFIRKCNALNQTVGEFCNATFGEETYQEFKNEIEDGRDDYGNLIVGESGENVDGGHGHGHGSPDMGMGMNMGMGMEYGQGSDDDDVLKHNVNESAFLPHSIEPNFYLPKSIQDIPNLYHKDDAPPNGTTDTATAPSPLYPLYYRASRERAHPEAYGIFLPNELIQELNDMVQDSGLYHHARRLIYDVGSCDSDGDGDDASSSSSEGTRTDGNDRRDKRGEEEEQAHHLMTLNDGMMWGCSTESRWRGMDMIWLNPANELSFEYYLSYLRRGNFDAVLDAIGTQMQSQSDSQSKAKSSTSSKSSLKSLMMVGMEVVFLSHFDHDQEYHQIYSDMPSAKGSFYAISIPLHIPNMGGVGGGIPGSGVGGGVSGPGPSPAAAATFIGDEEYGLPLSHHTNRGIVRGGGTSHGTAECDYRPYHDIRMSLTIYMADLDEDNIADIVQENSALWPTEGDFEWYESQKGRMWMKMEPKMKKDGDGNSSGSSRSLKQDVGRDRDYVVEDMRDDCQALLSKSASSSSKTTFCNDGKPSTSTMEQRLDCAKTCGIYLEQDLYDKTLDALMKGDMDTLAQLHDLKRSNYVYEPAATANAPMTSQQKHHYPPGHQFIYENDPELTHVPEEDDDKYVSKDIEPNFLVPKEHVVEVGELFPLYYRDTRERVKNDEAYGIALPPQLLKEFQAYVEKNGMLQHARRLIYEEEPFGNTEHRLYKLDDGMTWGCMGPRWGGMDMIWIDPADEQCFESMMSVLRRGDFDIVLDAVGKKFNLDALMVTGIGPIFLSHFKHDPQYNQIHVDLPEARGSFYNVVVPLYIPKGGATLYVGDSDKGKALPIQMRYNVATVLGAATPHGTGECDYREDRDVRLSVAIYLADVNEDNIEDVAGDSTSLWPTEGDLAWFWSQKGRVWRRDGSRSLKEDIGRSPLGIKDDRDDCEAKKHLCMTDPTGVRLECSKTCEVYLTDDEYKSILQNFKKIDAESSAAGGASVKSSIVLKEEL